MTTAGDTLVTLIDLAQDRGLHAAAALAWLVYDYLLSLQDEVELIWSSPDTIPKLLYFISRYFGLVVASMACADIPRLYCRSAVIWAAVSLYTLVCCVELSLMLRIYALYERSRLSDAVVFYILGSAFIAETLCIGVINGLGFQVMLPRISPYPSDWPIEGCFYPPTPSWFHATWLPLAGFESESGIIHRAITV
ncbi:hypothetical protein DAEQUDRAFT_737706 [Daedalea quercina L-15889]|uniref:DUF6533 domain-containing protein n=1 Tax=Daedalea quercina L-15889 TaxID=1314783 RepID=A0A165QUQ0_9APHY|nr:hypothetical protein DAEQUDRAFT_737706 [Daedalea quercina L-15889]